MSPLVYAVVIMVAFATAHGADDSIDCYDEKGNLLWPLDEVDLLKCKVWCPPGCPNGCLRHNLCDCGKGYKDSRTREEVKAKARVRCVHVCSNGCVNGDCVGPETCRCWSGYMRDLYRPHICVRGD